MSPLPHLKPFNLTELLQDATGKPLQIDLEQIDFDPAQPRRQFDEMALAELADSIRLHGVLQPVSLRPHPSHKHRYLINMGERRVRAARQVGTLTTIPAFIEAQCDPFAQAAENVHREELVGLDLARFIAEREREGYSRAEIAQRLGKPKSFVTEVAALNDAPAEILTAFQDGRIPDTRVAYQLTRALEAGSTAVMPLLAGGARVERQESAALSARGVPRAVRCRKPGLRRSASRSTITGFRVSVEGKPGQMPLLPGRTPRSAVVTFDDGTERDVALTGITLLDWMDAP